MGIFTLISFTPDVYSYQAIMNRTVIENLTNQGDNLEKEREIDHWLYFSSEENINIAIKKLEELDYKILSSKKLDDEKNYPYQLNISRMDKCYIQSCKSNCMGTYRNC